MNNANVTTVKSKPSVEQDRVINAPTNQDVLIVAGAGSGKTYTMTRRVIQLIQSSVAPESILGLTFTNKAAAELLSRVSAEVSASGAKSFLKPEVMTYDAFFQSIVRRYGLLVGFNQNTMPLSDAGAMEIIKSIIGKYLDNPQNHNKNLNKLYDFDTLCSDVMKLCAEISCSMIGVDAQGNTCSSVPQAVQKIREWNNEFAEHLKNVIGNKKVESPLPAKSPAIPKYRKVKKTAGMSAEDVTKISAEKFKQACKKYEKYWDDSCLQLCVNLYNSCVKRDILLDLVLQFDAEKKRVNMAQFSDFTIAAYYLVTHFPSICAQYKNQYSQVLLDEYQDTSTTQAMLINTLFHAENDGDNDGDFASSKRTHVMAVGDPFQAIYSFRGASTGAFCKFEQDFNINEQNKYSLTVTRRNSLFILKVANALTEPMRGENGDNSTQNASRRFSSIDDREVQVETLKPKEDAPNGTIAALFMPSQAEEIDAVVRFAQKIIEKQEKQESQGSQVSQVSREPQLAILFRSKANMPKYAEKLESAGIRTSIVGYSSLIEKPAVKDVLSLLKVVQDHSDSNSLMRLLATPRFALSTSDLGALAAIANSANTEYLYNIYSSAGLLEADLPKSQWDSAVRNLRNKANSGEISGQVINIYGGVYLADLIMRDFSTKNDQWVNQMQQKLSIRGFDAVKRLSKILHNVEGIQRNSLTNVMQAAVQALNVDIDTAVGSALKYKDFSNQIILDDMRSVLDSLNAIVETYIQEMGEWQDVSLRGLISWIDSAKNLDSQSGSSVSSSSQTEPAQVVLMTVHQSKGLQWPAVAVVGLNEGAFPSNQGDSLKVDDNGQASARIPIEFGASVPSALRVDANILPHFPHTVTRAEAMHPEKAMQSLDSVQKIFDEIKPDRIKALCDFAEAVKEVDSCDSSDSGDFLSEETRRVYNAYKSQQNVDSMPFTQSEERGIQLHMDERHLMYVALTRAKFAALLTGSATSGDSAQSGRKRSASVFLNESINAIKNLNGAIEVQRCDSNEENKTESKESEEYEEQDVFGFIAGDDAQEFAAEFSKIAPQSDSSSLEPTLKWPCTLSSTIEKSLIESAKLVENCDSDLESVYDSSINTNPKSLLYKAKIFIQDADLTSQNDCDYSLEELAEKVNKISSGSRLNVTSLQKISKIAQNAKTSVYNNLLACIRPIPSIPSIDANLGTKFHAWAQQFVDSATPSEFCACYEWKNIVKHGISLEKTPENRQKVIDDFNQSRKDSDSQSCALNQWKQRLIESRWAKRVPLAAEMPILMQIDDSAFADRIINGTLDAVFAGGLDAGDTTKLYTIVDWKTGKRPKSVEDIRLKLEQLDWYRMLLARATNVDLRCIDATLYYVSEARAENREIHALCKTRDEILSEASF
ncbi:ATP-dependent helicase [Gardnerella vaginalis]|uniref:ATP-dependent DNA helicase n=1 Tax=Gardnerella vaginalis TaxID=2702 RepID=UPI00200E5544|nr:ATP-dependent DNA helicase [Gardnerella vaginalis]UQA87628.1 ATP-dependent helicase [Gardnerella vaginalis]